MATESLLKEVEERRKKEIARLEAEFQSKREEVERTTETEIRRISDSAKMQASESVQRERIRIEGAGKLQAKKLLFDATEKMLENNLSAVSQYFAEYARTKDYPQLLNRMVRYSQKRLGGGKVLLICRKADAETLSSDSSVQIISSDLNSMGGLRAENEDRTLELDLTFEEILRNHQDEIRALLQNA
jgi:V/A-type H+-transporting ATPase subunit E